MATTPRTFGRGQYGHRRRAGLWVPRPWGASGRAVREPHLVCGEVLHLRMMLDLVTVQRECCAWCAGRCFTFAWFRQPPSGLACFGFAFILFTWLLLVSISMRHSPSGHPSPWSASMCAELSGTLRSFGLLRASMSNCRCLALLGLPRHGEE